MPSRPLPNADSGPLFDAYSRDVPDGTYAAVLDARAWGRKMNLWAFWTAALAGSDEARQVALCVFRERRGERYTAPDGRVDLADVDDDTLYRLVVQAGRLVELEPISE